ncbi:putative nuclease HARBI1 [Monomorium pharaonis]|nr:putative nuclease HARBI1 [Monomorium pharaonis]
MPQDQEMRNENRRLFNNLGKGNGAIGLPGVDGAIDCTHVRLVDTRFQNISEIYRNRKGYFSLNVQTVVGPRMEFLDIVPEWPGSAHDSRIFQNSLLCIRYIENQLDGGILVGDRGYPCLPFLMTPIPNPRTDEEMSYNDIQCRTRLIVERTYGVWKRRFPCLSRGLTTKLITSTTIVVACAVLHNMSLIFNDVLPDDDELYDYEEVPVHEPNNNAIDGFAAREAMIARMFN